MKKFIANFLLFLLLIPATSYGIALNTENSEEYQSPTEEQVCKPELDVTKLSKEMTTMSLEQQILFIKTMSNCGMAKDCPPNTKTGDTCGSNHHCEGPTHGLKYKCCHCYPDSKGVYTYHCNWIWVWKTCGFSTN